MEGWLISIIAGGCFAIGFLVGAGREVLKQRDEHRKLYRQYRARHH